MFYYITGLASGLVLLWWSGEKSVKYSERISGIYGLSTFFIGFVLMAVSTGLPELAITITSAIKDVGGLSAGTIIGSNFSDISLVLGIPALFIGTIKVIDSEYKNFSMMLLVTSLVMAAVFVLGTLTRIHGLILIFLYIGCLIFLWKSRYAKGVVEAIARRAKNGRQISIKTKATVMAKLILSMAGLLLASEISVRSAIELAKIFDYALESIGATIFAVGTSLPELSVSINAVRKKDYSLALGNALGSVLEQGTLILGILAILSKSPTNISNLRVIAPFMFTSFGVIGFGILRRRRINRLEGGAMILLYAVFIFYFYSGPFYLKG